MKIGKRKLRMSSGEVRTFKSQGARDRFEKVASFFHSHPRKAKRAFGKSRKGRRSRR